VRTFNIEEKGGMKRRLWQIREENRNIVGHHPRQSEGWVKGKKFGQDEQLSKKMRKVRDRLFKLL